MITKVPINEFSTEVLRDGVKAYTEIGAGINHQKDDGSFAESSAVFVSSRRTGIDWECYTTHNRVGLKNDISSGAYSVFSQIGNAGQVLRSKPVAIAYLNTETKEWTIIANLQSSIASVSGNKILYKDAFKNCDLEYVIQKDRLKQNLYIKSIDGFSKSPYDAAKTQVVVVTKFDLDNFETPKIVDSRGEVSLSTMKTASITAKNVGDETIDGELVFSKQRFGMCEATDNKGDTQKIRKRIIKHDGNYYLLEGLPYLWLASASYPVLLDYTTKSGAINDETWTSGTYYISANLEVNEHKTLTLNAGAVVKVGSNVSITIDGLVASGTSDNRIYITSFNDNTIGETIDGSSGSPAAGDWGNILMRYWNDVNDLVNLDFVTIRYASRGFYMSRDTTNNDFYYGKTFNLDNVVIKNCSVFGFFIGEADSGKSTVAANDIQIDTCVIGFAIQYDANASTIKRALIINNTSRGIGGNYTLGTFQNCTIDSNGVGIVANVGGTIALTDCIISNNTTNLTVGAGSSLNLNYCLQYNNGTTNAASANTNALASANPNFATGTAATGYIGDMTYFLNQSTSPCKDAGSDTAANLGMDAHTTATDATLDSSTVDVGYHYEPDDVAVTGSEEEAAYSALSLLLSIPAIVVAYVYAASASFSAAALSLAIPSVTASYVQQETAAFSPVSVIVSPQTLSAEVTETYQATFTSVALSLVQPSTIASYQEIDTAAFSSLALSLAIPSVTATYVEVRTAAFVSVSLALAIPSTTATYAEVDSAAFAPLSLVLSVPAMSATVAGEFTAAFMPLSLNLTQPAIAASYVQEEAAAFTAVGLVLAQPAIAASYIDEDVAAFEALALQFVTPAMLAIFEEMAAASFDPLDLIFTIPDRAASESPVVIASFSPLGLLLMIPSTGAFCFRETINLTSTVVKTLSASSRADKTEEFTGTISKVEALTSSVGEGS